MKKPIKVSILWFLAKMMNENWIEASFRCAKRCCDGTFTSSLTRFEYLDAVGLFETSWMIFDHTSSDNGFGYPR
ncbi:hypothetical protein LCGC14_1442430 [marine sediment metagenome]|uniref:Uncharacterized protein n=1 Tax=marine sediment metagenome TaxID=412755 RepID=A0A0F9K6K4_9ZZZZ